MCRSLCSLSVTVATGQYAVRASKASVGTGLAHFSIAMLHAKAVSSVSSLATKGTYFEPNAKQVAGYSLGHLHGPSLKSTAKLPPTEKTEKSGSVFSSCVL